MAAISRKISAGMRFINDQPLFARVFSGGEGGWGGADEKMSAGAAGASGDGDQLSEIDAVRLGFEVWGFTFQG